MELETIEYNSENGVGTITLNRPRAKNAVSSQLMNELHHVMDLAEKDDIRALILTGTENSFCAGADLKEVAGLYGEAKHNFTHRAQVLMRRIEQLPIPVIAAMNGYAFGGGLELALACDIRLIVPGTKLGLTEVTIGLNPAWGGSQRLPRLIGHSRARYLVLTGEVITSEEAVEMGMISRLVEGSELMKEAKKLAHRIAGNAPRSVSAAKHVLNGHLYGGDISQMEYEAAQELTQLEDFQEGIRSALERRKPEYKGK